MIQNIQVDRDMNLLTRRKVEILGAHMMSGSSWEVLSEVFKSPPTHGAGERAWDQGNLGYIIFRLIAYACEV